MKPGPSALLRRALSLGRVAIRLPLLGTLIGTFLATQLLSAGVPWGSRKLRRAVINRWGCLNLMRILGVRLDVRGVPVVTRNHFLVGNHLSWLDPILLSTIEPAQFITSNEVKGHPLLGPITRLAGCLFVDRRAATLRTELRQISQAEPDVLAWYPEATSGNGTALLPFRSALFELALQAGMPVIPVAIRYLEVNGEALDATNRESIYYYGEKGFLEHLFGLLGGEGARAQLCFGYPLFPRMYRDRKEMAAEAWERVAWLAGAQPTAS